MDFISVENLIKILKEKNINLGKGDPYNRLRYYTKIGWLPHMTRKKDSTGVIVGHYPLAVIEKLIQIEELKKSGVSNEEIEKIIKMNKVENNKFIEISSLLRKINISKIIIFLIVSGFIFESFRYNSLKENLSNLSTQQNDKSLPAKKIIDYGISFLPKGQNIIFIPTSSVSSTSIIMLNFYNNIGYGNNYFIKEIKEGQGFYIETNYSVTEESRFNWTIIQ